MDDVRAVMDAAGSRQATPFGISEGGPIVHKEAGDPNKLADAIHAIGKHLDRSTQIASGD